MKIYRMIVIIICVFSLSGCEDEESLAVRSLSFQGMEIEASFKRMTLGKESQGQTPYLLYADLSVVAKEETSFNLNCLAVTVNDHRSEKIYVDSVASYLTDRYLVKRETDLKVYWSFYTNLEGVNLSSVDLNFVISNECR